jgi:carbon starvation protein
MTLWPLFGATNQLIACLALLVVTTYLKRKGKPIYYTIIPAAAMFVITGFAMVHQCVSFARTGLPKLHLLLIGIVVIVLELWMIVETVGVLAGKVRPGGDEVA